MQIKKIINYFDFIKWNQLHSNQHACHERKKSKENLPVFSLEFNIESKARINTFQQLKPEVTWIDSVISANIHTQLKKSANIIPLCQ